MADEDTLNADAVDELPAEQAEGKFVLTPRMIAIAKGEDPDAPSEPVAEEIEQDEVVEEAEESVETPAEEQADEPTSWVTDADRQRATAYGLDAEDLAAYSSREEFGRVLRSLDKAVTRQQQKWENSRFTPEKKTEPETEEVDDTKPVINGKVNLAYYEKNYDEGTVEAMRVVRAQQDATEKLLASSEESQKRYEEEQIQRYHQGFHQAAEQMRPDFFGRTVDKSGLPLQLSQTELDRRQKLYSAADVYIDHIIREQERQGLPPSVPPWPVVLKQAEQLAFRDEIAQLEKTTAKASREAQLKKVAANSQRRRPVASTAGSQAAFRNAPHEDPHSTQSIMQAPEVAAVLQRIRDGVSSN